MNIMYRISELCGHSTRKSVAIVIISVVFAVSGADRALAMQDDMSEMLVELQQALSLSDEQTQQVGAAMATFAQNMEATLASHQSAGPA